MYGSEDGKSNSWCGGGGGGGSYIYTGPIGARDESKGFFADVTLQVTPNEAHVLEELNLQFLVTKKVRKENPVRCTVFR